MSLRSLIESNKAKLMSMASNFDPEAIVDRLNATIFRDEGSPYGPGSFGSLRPGSYLNREWEIVTVEEVKRRLSLQDLVDVSKFPLPSGSAESTILNEEMIRQLVTIMPARAEGYPWVS